MTTEALKSWLLRSVIHLRGVWASTLWGKLGSRLPWWLLQHHWSPFPFQRGMTTPLRSKGMIPDYRMPARIADNLQALGASTDISCMVRRCKSGNILPSLPSTWRSSNFYLWLENRHWDHTITSKVTHPDMRWSIHLLFKILTLVQSLESRSLRSW